MRREQMVRNVTSPELNQRHKSQLRDVNKHMWPARTYINHIRDVVDVILRHDRICRCQVEQIVVAGFCAFQLIL